MPPPGPTAPLRVNPAEEHLREAQRCLERDDHAAAVRAAEAALAAGGKDAAVQVNAGAVLAQAGEIGRARAVLRRAVGSDAKSNALAHFNLAKVLAEEPDPEPERAVMHYRRAVQLQPGLAPAWRNLGNLYLSLDRPQDAAEAFRARLRARRGPDAVPVDDMRITTAAKLAHDIEQFDYLMAAGLLPASFADTAAVYRAALAALPSAGTGVKAGVRLPPEVPKLAQSYNRLIRWEPPAALSGAAINPALDSADLEAGYRARAPGIAVVDDLLTPEALTALRRFCLESTIWFDFSYTNGYLGALFDDGFISPLALQIAAELRRKMPNVIGGHELHMMWAFKCDSALSAVGLHADAAAINVNFWITPDDANLDPEASGLMVWDKAAPAEWSFKKYNRDEEAIRRFLADSGARAHEVPYRQNRALIFNSDLFHQSGSLRFKPGYANRRINVTMLFGRRGVPPRFPIPS